MYTRIIVTAMALAVLATSPCWSDSYDAFDSSERSIRTEPVYQTGVGVSYRLDDLDKYDYVPSVEGNFYYFFHPKVAFRAGIAHNSLTRLSDATSFHMVVGDVGLRVNTSLTGVTPFFETGLSFPYTWGVDRGYRYTDLQAGAHVALGLSMRVSKSMAFDLTFNQIVNHWSREVDPVLSPGITSEAPCPLGEDCSPMRGDPEGAFNPATLSLVFRFGL